MNGNNLSRRRIMMSSQTGKCKCYACCYGGYVKHNVTIYVEEAISGKVIRLEL